MTGWQGGKLLGHLNFLRSRNHFPTAIKIINMTQLISLSHERHIHYYRQNIFLIRLPFMEMLPGTHLVFIVLNGLGWSMRKLVFSLLTLKA